jgi:adenylate cyclase
MPERTVVFADLTGSTGVFESLGNAKATQAITRLTDWLGKVCAMHQGTVVKNLGDGVLMVFAHNAQAVDAVQEMQQVHTERIKAWPERLKMRLQIGMARGEVVEQSGDYFGDAVNVAARLSDLCGADQIFADEAVMKHLPPSTLVRSRTLGPMNIRGRVQSCMVCRLEWQSEVMSDFFTVPASLSMLPPTPAGATPCGSIALAWLDIEADFSSTRLPMHIGRDGEAQFVVNDPRVSRLHVKIVFREGRFYLEDVSSYGTWVRFAGSDAIVALRRQECVLPVHGEIALGAPFEDFSVPTVAFKFPAATKRLAA